MFRAVDGPREPLLWGTEEHVSELLGDARFERREVEWRDSSVDRCAGFLLESFRPMMARGPAEREPYRRFLDSVNEADDGTLRFHGEYLVAVTV